MGARLHIRHRRLRPRCDAVRGTLMSAEDLIATPSQTVGPFFHFGLTTPFGREPGASAAESIRLIVRVLDGDGAPIDDAVVEYWQPGATRAPKSADGSAQPTAECGRAATGADGSCEIVIRPPQDVAGTSPQAAHLNLCLFARGLLRQLCTRVYFAGDPALASDPVLALVPADRRETLIARPDNGRWSFDLHLQGARETVFFDR